MTCLSISPFIEFPLPDDDLLDVIDNDINPGDDLDEFDGNETQPVLPKTKPLVLVSTYQRDVKVSSAMLTHDSFR